jgi:hypothetical protein
VRRKTKGRPTPAFRIWSKVNFAIRQRVMYRIGAYGEAMVEA